MESGHWKIITDTRAHGRAKSLLLLILLATTQFLPSSGIGMNLGTQANNLPAPADIINFYQNCSVQKIRLFEPNPDILNALRNSSIGIAVGVRNEDLQNLGNPQAATDWVNTYIIPYVHEVNFQYITLGNEVIPGPLAQFVPQAMNNIYNSLIPTGEAIKVTTVIPASALENSYPPSAGAFSADILPIMTNIISFLSKTKSPLMVNVYPYFSYAADPEHISLEYATFQSKDPVVIDGQYQYYNMFDAMVDAFNAAIEKVNVGDVTVAISETGWPTEGNDPYASIENARQYNFRLFCHVLHDGTPRKPQQLMDTFIFEMFDENLKPAGVEQNFGVFHPNMKQKYQFFACGDNKHKKKTVQGLTFCENPVTHIL